MSIIKEGNTDLDEYKNILKENKYYAIEKIRGHYYTIHPIGVSLIAVPFVYIIDKGIFAEFIRNRSNKTSKVIDIITIHREIELFIASFIIAVTAVFIYLIVYLFLDRKYTLLVTFLFAFCTPAWSTASRALWQHGPSILMLTIVLYIILLAIEKPWLIQFASIPLAFSYVIRPTNSLSVFLLTLFVLIQYRQYLFRYLFWAMTVAIPFIFFNFTVYHSPLSWYYLPNRIGSNPHFLEALAGNLISPARGLFVFSPVLLFSIYGMVLKIKNNQADKLDYFLIGIILLHWISVSSFHNWWAGYSFGPRFFSDMIPYFIYFLIPFLKKISELKGSRKVVLVSVLLCFSVISFFIHYRGATVWEVWLWNIEPVKIRVKPERIWDWQDIQFLRGLS
jgi:hypothetical protein